MVGSWRWVFRIKVDVFFFLGRFIFVKGISPLTHNTQKLINIMSTAKKCCDLEKCVIDMEDKPVELTEVEIEVMKTTVVEKIEKKPTLALKELKEEKEEKEEKKRNCGKCLLFTPIVIFILVIIGALRFSPST